MEIYELNELLQWAGIVLIALFTVMNRVNLNFINKFFKHWANHQENEEEKLIDRVLKNQGYKPTDEPLEKNRL